MWYDFSKPAAEQQDLNCTGEKLEGKDYRFFVITRCLIVLPPPKPYGERQKEALFFIFLNVFTFACRTKKITFFFVKNLTKKCIKNCFFHFLELKSHFVEKSDFKSQNRKKKVEKKGKFLKFYQIL